MQKVITDFKDFTQNILRDDNIYLGISELSLATGIPATQLRYWTERGYIKSEENLKLKFNFDTVFLVRSIKIFQEQGFTLSAAVKKAYFYGNVTSKLRNTLTERLIEVTTDQNDVKFDLGVFEPQPNKHLLISIKDGKSFFELH